MENSRYVTKDRSDKNTSIMFPNHAVHIWVTRLSDTAGEALEAVHDGKAGLLPRLFKEWQSSTDLS